ncbi:MAG: YlxR family protein [Lachnospiraceae bacterium]|nr:YlxR family protein [Lachnospiraceae bacterium]
MAAVKMRQCVGCGDFHDGKEMLRVVKNAEGVSYDATGRAGGRGAYLCRNADCVETAFRKKGFERSFRMQFEPALMQELKEALMAAVTE